MRPPVELHRLISAMIHDRTIATQLGEEPDVVFEQFGVPVDQRAMLKADPVGAPAVIGVHPNLQLKYLAFRGLLQLSPASVQPFLDSLGGNNGSDR